MRFVVPDTMMEILDKKFRPGRAVHFIPRLDFMLSGPNHFKTRIGHPWFL